jgi:DNA-binding XRE family transcriptional regulator
MAIPETLGERIKAALAELQMSQTQAAQHLDITRNTLGLWVNGEDVPERQLIRVASLTGKSCAWLRYGVVDALDVVAERYARGYKDAVEHIRDSLDHMQPPRSDLRKTK